MSEAMFWVRLFAVAEFYMIKGLTSLAADGFIRVIEGDNTITSQQLSETFHQAYTTTTDSQRLLRDAVIKETLEDPAMYLAGETACFNELIEAVPEFAADMVKALAKEHSKKNGGLALPVVVNALVV